MRSSVTFISIALLVLAAATGHATVRLVPDRYPLGINDAILHANNGDTVSVWGYGDPPFTYYENVDYQNKGVFVVNRSFLPGQTPGYDSSWDHVIVDGQQAAAVVTISSVPTAVATLKGFTIENGRSGFGGGVNCDFSSACLIRNRIVHNHATLRGGGVYLEGGYPNCVVVAGNCISGNVADYIGGGLAEVNWSYDTAFVQGNVLDSNTAGLYGGGVYLYYCLSLATSPSIYDLDDNTITNNCVPDSAGASGGGVYAAGWCFPARRNVITGNAPSGVYTQDADGSAIFGTMDLGTSQDPGYNVLMQNGGHDLIMVVSVGPINTNAVGNYWGTLNTQTILNRILLLGDGHILFGPVAASGKWFDVTGVQNCQDSVLVTGDVQVDAGATLQIAAGKMFTLYPNPDDTIQGMGCDPTLCDLIVDGPQGSVPGGVLSADGSSGTIYFQTFTNQARPWGGIMVQPGATASLNHCNIQQAYIAVCAFSGASLTVQNSNVHDNQVGAIQTTSATAVITSDTIASNGVNGIVCNDLQPQSQVSYNDVADNLYYGIRCNGYTHSATLNITGNTVDAGQSNQSAQHGLDLHGVNSNVNVARNVVMNYRQAGVNCASTATPVLRWNTIDQNWAGVLSDATSLPNLGTNPDDPGDNSILMGNSYWVVNHASSTILAECNWWGTPTPNQYPSRFVGPVDRSHWLLGPPTGQGGGQSASRFRVAQTLLLGCSPNPCTRNTVVRYELAEKELVSLKLYDLEGRLAATLASGSQTAGEYGVPLELASPSQGRSRLAQGVYLLRFTCGGTVTTQKLIIE